MSFKLSYKPFGERAILMEWPPRIDVDILKDILNLKCKLKKNDIKSLVDVKSAYNSLLISGIFCLASPVNDFLYSLNS